MKKIGGNDIIEMWGVKRSAVESGPHILNSETRVMDTRAKMLSDFCRAWGQSAGMADVLAAAHGEGGRPYNCQDVVTRAAEMVEAIWFESERRGWIIDLPTFDEIV